MRILLADDVATMTSAVRTWVAQSHGHWQTGKIELLVPGPSAQDFHCWYERAMADKREEVLRAGHSEHFILHPDGIGMQMEVIENIGEIVLPWRVFYRPLPEDAFLLPWENDFPVRFVAEVVDVDGLRVGYTKHRSRDVAEGTRLLLRTLLPKAAPPSLVERHLWHFRNRVFQLDSSRLAKLLNASRVSADA